MKKLLSIVLFAALIVMLCACGSKNTNAKKEPSPKAEPAETETLETEAPSEEESTAYDPEELMTLTGDNLRGQWHLVSSTVDGVPMEREESGTIHFTQDATVEYHWESCGETIDEYALNMSVQDGFLLEDCPIGWYVELVDSSYNNTYQVTLTGKDRLTLVQEVFNDDGTSKGKTIAQYERFDPDAASA